MKKFILPFCLLAYVQLKAQVWNTLPLPEGLAGTSLALHGSKIFLAGSTQIGIGGVPTDKVFIYDAATGGFSEDQLSAPREAMAAVTVGDKVMFAGGAAFVNNSTYINTTDTVEVYDVNTGTWSYKKLSAPRRWITAQVVNGKAYFAGGREPVGPFTDVLDIYDPATDSWVLDTLALPIRGATSSVDGDKLLLFLDDKCQILNTLTGEWEVVTFPFDRGFGRAAVATPDEIWFVGGSGYLTTIDIYHRSDGSWTSQEMLVPRYYPSACFLNGKIIIAGGLNELNTPTDLVEIWNTQTSEWEEPTQLSVPRDYMSWEGQAPVIGDSAFFIGGRYGLTGLAYPFMDIYTDTTGTVSGLFTPVLKNIHLQAFPSPFSEALTIQVDFEKPTSGSLEVLDLAGRQAFFQNIDNQSIWKETIAAQGWAGGAYLLKVRTADGVAIRKILKH